MVIEIFRAGVGALNDYIATHVLTCLVPAFLLAGAMVTFIRREAILALLGVDAEIEHLRDPREFAPLGVMTTPAVLIDGRIVVSGRVPTVQSLKEEIGKAA